MTDRELLEDAAKAAGKEHYGEYNAHAGLKTTGGWWNPLADDGDAFRLMVKADIDLVQFGDFARADYMIGTGYFSVNELYGTDPLAATRRAIVRAAAEIGRSKDD
jgi:hypothetical protein